MENLVLKRASNYDGINLLSEGLYEYNCDNCKKNIQKNRFHCMTCGNYDLCMDCFRDFRFKHSHNHLFKKSNGNEYRLELDDIMLLIEKIIDIYKLREKYGSQFNYDRDTRLINDVKYFVENIHQQKYITEHALFIAFRELSRLRNDEFNKKYEIEKEKSKTINKFLFCKKPKKPKELSIDKISYSKELDLKRIIHGTYCYNFDKYYQNIKNSEKYSSDKFAYIFLACFNSYTLQKYLEWMVQN